MARSNLEHDSPKSSSDSRHQDGHNNRCRKPSQRSTAACDRQGVHPPEARSVATLPSSGWEARVRANGARRSEQKRFRWVASLATVSRFGGSKIFRFNSEVLLVFFGLQKSNHHGSGTCLRSVLHRSKQILLIFSSCTTALRLCTPPGRSP